MFWVFLFYNVFIGEGVSKGKGFGGLEALFNIMWRFLHRGRKLESLEKTHSVTGKMYLDEVYVEILDTHIQV